MAFLVCQPWNSLLQSINEKAEVPGPSPTLHLPVLNTQGPGLNGAWPDPHREETDFRKPGGVAQ